jgi:hypothetical protein
MNAFGRKAHFNLGPALRLAQDPKFSQICFRKGFSNRKTQARPIAAVLRRPFNLPKRLKRMSRFADAHPDAGIANTNRYR